jgi:hypothetical protein
LEEQVMSQMPANAQLSPDGQWWWDGAQWQPVPQLHDTPGVHVQHGQTPHEIEMPPDGGFNPGSYPVATDAEVRNALLAELGKRLGEHQIATLSALTAFREGAQGHIENLDSGEATYDFGPVVGALETAMKMAFPEVGPAIEAIGVTKTLLEFDIAMVQAYDGHADLTMGDAKQKLSNSLHKLVEGYADQSQHAWDKSKAKLPALVEEVLSDLDDKTMTVEPGFIGGVCDYAGVPDSAGTYQIVRQQLEYDFFGVYEGVRAQLQNAKGGDHVSQIGWEHDAYAEEKRLYKEDGEKAWNEAYDEHSAPR